MAKKVLCVIFNGFEEIEMVFPVDLLRRAGIEVVIATTENTASLKGSNGIRILADALLIDVNFDDFDAIFIPGGPGCFNLTNNINLISVLQNFNKQKKLICAICAAPLILHTAGILTDKEFTAHKCTHDILKLANKEKNLIMDGNIITASGLGKACELGIEMVAALTDRKIAENLAIQTYCN